VLSRHKGSLLFTRLESIFAFNFTTADSIDSLEKVKACDMNAFATFHNEMLKRGVYLSPSGYEVGFLSKEHTDADIEMTARAVAESLDSMHR
jgi:glutamate-1-semialdehyde 2,1-aminomutase